MIYAYAMRVWVLGFVAACTASAQPAPSSVEVLATIPAWDHLAIGGKLIVVDDAFLTVSAFDTTTGKRAWKSKVIEEANGRHTLQIVGANVHAWFGTKLASIEPSTGRVHQLGTRGYNGVEWREGGCALDVVEGVCAQRCQCSFSLFDCATNKDIGPRYQGTFMEFHESDLDGNRMSSSGCFGSSSSVFGRAGTLALISTDESVTKQKRADKITAAIDLKTGKEAWRITSGAFLGGHTPDGKTCWFYGFSGAANIYDCASGKKLWQTKTSASARVSMQFTADAGMLVVSAEAAATEASLHDVRTGIAKWTAKLPSNTTAWLRGTAAPAATAATVAILDPATGKITRDLTLSKDMTLVADGRGGFLTWDRQFVMAFDADGQRTGSVELADAVPIVGDSLIVAKLPAELVILDRGTLRERGRYVGDFTSLAVEGGLGPSRISALVYDGKRIGSVTLLKVR